MIIGGKKNKQNKTKKIGEKFQRFGINLALIPSQKIMNDYWGKKNNKTKKIG